MVDDTYAVHFAQGFVQNEMSLQVLTRGDLGRQLTCLASNNDNTPPSTSTITVNMTLSILGVKIEEIDRLWAGEEIEVECTVWGSRPPPTIVWWLGPEMKVQARTKMEDGGNLTISVLDFTPTPEEDSVMLICQATNDDLPDQAVQDSRLLYINYAPVVDIRLGPSLDPDRIKEGDDVYFECPVKAKPAVFKIVWKHNGIELSDGEGVLVTNMTLVLQKVNRGHSGDYSCEATNIRDTTSSMPIYLDVKYTPICVQGNKSTFAVARRENMVVTCRVDANPANVTFSWSFNNSAEAVVIPDARFVSDGTETKVNYTPEDEMDYGTLQCRANNSVGMQTMPCLYKIIPAGKPDPPHNCKVSEVTISSLYISCLPGDDGGLNQTFLLQIYQIGSTSKKPLTEMKSSTPSFSVSSLRPATPYRIVITAVNKMGTSRTIELKTYTARVPQIQQETSAEPTRDRESEKTVPLLVLVGVGAVLLSLMVIVPIVVRFKRRRSNGGESRRRKDSVSGRTSSSGSADAEAPSTDLASEGTTGVDECDPDILSHTPGATELSQGTEKGVDIAILPASVYNPLVGGHIYPPKCLLPGHATVHPPMQPQLIATSQVPYYSEPFPAQHVGNLSVLSAAALAQRQPPCGSNIDIQCYPPKFNHKDNHQQHPYPSFPHICHVTPCCATKQDIQYGSSQHGRSNIQENIFQASPEARRATVAASQGAKEIPQWLESKTRPQNPSPMPLPPSVQMASTSVMEGKPLYQQTPSSSSSLLCRDTETLRRAIRKSGTQEKVVGVGGNGEEAKVESTV